MAKPIILITGANGQLGAELSALQPKFPAYELIGTGRQELSIQNSGAVNNWFAKHKPAFCINAAAYTAVDKAETEQELAYSVNADGPANLAAASREHGARFVHISTDYVFNGSSSAPYRETDTTDPVNTYGASKLKGEQLTLQNNPDSIIIRTAWVYSEFGANFVKTMLRLMKDRPRLNVVDDQIGAPTYAADLAAAIMHIISHPNWQPGIYHYSNRGRISWFDFAVAIARHSESKCEVAPIPSSQYPTPAKRPAFSLLDTSKIQSVFDLSIPNWEESLKICLHQLNSQA